MLRALLTEVAKWRRTWFLVVTAGAALAAPLLMFLVFVSRGGEPVWPSIMQQILQFDAIMIGPLLATLIGGQLIAVEYQWDTWKLSLTAPVPRWAIYLAKWVVSVVWVLALTALTELGALLCGFALHASGSLQLGFWTGAYLLTGVGLCAMLSIYHLITFISRNFFVTSGVGIVATFAALVGLNSKYVGLYPISANVALTQLYLGRTIPPETLGSPTVWMAVMVAPALIGLVASLVYIQKADYR